MNNLTNFRVTHPYFYSGFYPSKVSSHSYSTTHSFFRIRQNHVLSHNQLVPLFKMAHQDPFRSSNKLIPHFQARYYYNNRNDDFVDYMVVTALTGLIGIGILLLGAGIGTAIISLVNLFNDQQDEIKTHLKIAKEGNQASQICLFNSLAEKCDVDRLKMLINKAQPNKECLIFCLSYAIKSNKKDQEIINTLNLLIDYGVEVKKHHIDEAVEYASPAILYFLSKDRFDQYAYVKVLEKNSNNE